MLIKFDLGQKSITRDKETFHNVKILNSTVLHLYVSKNLASKYIRQKLTKLTKDSSSTITVVNFNVTY